MQLTTRQRRFDQVGRVHRTIRLACTNQCMHFVDEQNHLACGFGHLGQNCFQALFKLAAIFSTRDKGTHV